MTKHVPIIDSGRTERVTVTVSVHHWSTVLELNTDALDAMEPGALAELGKQVQAAARRLEADFWARMSEPPAPPWPEPRAADGRGIVTLCPVS